ncbi:MAG: hypothetical protein GVY08_08860 [Bacteroidetes bacterium]|jgi:hypothetical protein|nr:hypothetical protein [Bacteroidota bacterium]
MKQFDKLRPIFQWIIAIAFAVILGLLLYGWIVKVIESTIWALGIFVMVPVIQFSITPLFTLLGFYTYYSMDYT